MEKIREKKGFICDMDGVIYHGNRLLPGVKEFVDWLYRENKSFLFLTNSSQNTPKGLSEKLYKMGLEIEESRFYTSALATAAFLSSQKPGCSAYVIGDASLYLALDEAGIEISDDHPDYVVIGESKNYTYESIVRATYHVNNGALLIGTNYDMTGIDEHGIFPACKALVAPVELATGKEAYYVGKPNPLMMRTGLRMLGVHSEDAAIIGDRMDTDIVAGIESGLDTCLVLSGVTTREGIERVPYRPRVVASGVGEIAGA